MKKLATAWMLLLPCAWTADTGADLFREHCAPCHGAKGEGGRGANLAVRRLPRAPDDATLGAIIAQGIPGTEMPVTRMTDQERARLIEYVRSLGHTETTQSKTAQVEGNPAAGERLFWEKGNCGRCHTVG